MTAAARLDESPIAGPLPRFELTDWTRRYGVVAGITGRGEGFNLGLLTGDSAAAVTGRWRKLIAELGPPFRTFAVGLQTHETRVAVHRDPPLGWLILDGVDGHATRTAGLLLTVTVADCVPIYLLHPRTGTVGLLHAGWRGVAAGILETGISTVSQLAQAPALEIVMHCGVAICGACYEVGSEVQTAVLGTPQPGGPLDLRAALTARAAAAGVKAISTTGWCAAHHHDRFFSHRRSGGRDGRMLAYLGVPQA